MGSRPLSKNSYLLCLSAQYKYINSWRKISGICVNRSVLNQPLQSEELLCFPFSLQIQRYGPKTFLCLESFCFQRLLSIHESKSRGTHKISDRALEAVAAWDCHLCYKLVLSTYFKTQYFVLQLQSGKSFIYQSYQKQMLLMYYR